MTPARLASRKPELTERVSSGLARAGVADAAWWWVPGRVEVFGKHTDYGGGPSLVGALPRGFVVAGAARADRRLRVFDTGDDSRFELDLATGRTHPDPVVGWRRYVNILARRLQRDFPGANLGADLVLASDLPRASGMSSSSALVVGLASALVELSGIAGRPDFLEAVPQLTDRGGYFACLENGLTYGRFEGDGGLGTFGGSEDQTAILCSREGRLSEFTYMPVRHVRDVALPAHWTFVFASSGVAAEKAGRAQAKYNRASLAVRALIDLWRAHAGPTASLTAALADDPAAAARCAALVDTYPVAGWTPAELRRRLDHFAAEVARVGPAADAVAAGDADALGRLAAASHADAAERLGNQIAETNRLVALAREGGAFAASAFGAGFGGSVWALIDTARVSDAAFAGRWLEAYLREFPDHARLATTFAGRPAPGLSRE